MARRLPNPRDGGAGRIVRHAQPKAHRVGDVFDGIFA
jgi:hypothetical protein